MLDIRSQISEGQETAVYAKLRRAKEIRDQRSIRRLHGLGKEVCFKRVALPSEFTRHVGNQDYLRGIYGLTVDGIVGNTITLLKR
jgi:hypothetical protein